MAARTSLLTKLYNNGFDKSGESDLKLEREIEEIKKSFEKSFSETRQPFSIYEFRETFDRYVGLSAEMRDDRREITTAEAELFRITNHGNKKLGEICLNRRNRKRLSFHHKIARRDFFEILKIFIDHAADRHGLLTQGIRMADLLNDFEARQLFESLAPDIRQFQKNQSVSIPEGEIWNSETHRPLTENQISNNLQVLTATANLSGKD